MRALTRADLHDFLRFDENGNLPGTLFGKHSIPADRIFAATLSSLSEDMGTVTRGTFIGGSEQGARVVVGDKGKGVQAYDLSGRRFFTLSWLDQSLYIGYDDGPGVVVRDGIVRANGVILEDGSVPITKLYLHGPFSAALLTSDMLFIGEGEPSDMASMSGFMASFDFAGGLHGGQAAWYCDHRTGHIRSERPTEDDDPYGGMIYTDTGAGGMTVANVRRGDMSYVEEAQSSILFRTFTQDDETLQWSTTDLAVYSNGNKFYIFSVDEVDSPELILVGRSGDTNASLSYHGMSLSDGRTGHLVTVGRQFTGVDLLAQGSLRDLRIGSLDVLLALGTWDDPDFGEMRGAQLSGAWLAFVDDPSRPWPVAPAAFPPNWRVFFPVQGSEELGYWDGTKKWKVQMELMAS